MQKSAAPSSRNWLRSRSSTSVLPGQDDGADEGGEQQDRDRLEGDQVRGEDRGAHRGRVRPVDGGDPCVGGQRGPGPAVDVDQGVAHDPDTQKARSQERTEGNEGFKTY